MHSVRKQEHKVEIIFERCCCRMAEIGRPRGLLATA